MCSHSARAGMRIARINGVIAISVRYQTLPAATAVAQKFQTHPLYGDVILAAQALDVGGQVVTDNVGHLSRFVEARLWGF